MSAPTLKRWEIKGSTGSHFDFLDGLRGVAILMVMAFHLFYTNPSSSRFESAVQYLIFTGWMGVPVFFVLSGFLISHPFFKDRSQDSQAWYARGYALRRVAKILPPFYLSIVIFTVFYWVRTHDVQYLHSAMRWMLGLESYTLPITDFNLSYWSLMVEAHFYAVLPLLFFLTRGLGLRSTTIVIVGVMLVVPLCLRLCAWPAGMSVLPPTRMGSEISFFVQRHPFCLLDFFAFGVAFGGIFTALKPRLADCKQLAWLGYLGVIMLSGTLLFWAWACKEYSVNVFPQHWSIETFKYLPAGSTFFLLFFIFNPDCLGARLLSLGWLRFIGIVSYEWFLFHGPVGAWFRDMLGRTEGSVWLYACKTVLPLVLTFIFSVLVYRYFSLPILHRVRDRLKNSLKSEVQGPKSAGD